MRFINGGKATPRALLAQRILPMFVRYHEPLPGFGFWAAIEKSSEEFIGWFCLRPRGDSDVHDIALGYRLRRALWGKGYATEGARALVRTAFTELGAERVFAGTYEHNRASRRVMEKAGMRLVRTFHSTIEDLESEDTYDASSPEPWEGEDVEYALTRDQWKRQESAGAGGEAAVPAGV